MYRNYDCHFKLPAFAQEACSRQIIIQHHKCAHLVPKIKCWNDSHLKQWCTKSLTCLSKVLAHAFQLILLFEDIYKVWSWASDSKENMRTTLSKLGCILKLKRQGWQKYASSQNLHSKHYLWEATMWFLLNYKKFFKKSCLEITWSRSSLHMLDSDRNGRNTWSGDDTKNIQNVTAFDVISFIGTLISSNTTIRFFDESIINPHQIGEWLQNVQEIFYNVEMVKTCYICARNGSSYSFQTQGRTWHCSLMTMFSD